MIERHPFAAWTVIGVLLGLTIAAPLISVVTISLGIAGIVLITRRSHEPDDALGIVAGAGLAFIAAGWLLPGIAAVAIGLGAHALIGRLAARRG